MPLAILFAFDGGVAVDELDHGARRAVAVAEAGLQHARIAAGSVLVPGGQSVEQLLGHVLVAQTARSKAARVEVAALGKRDVLVHHALQVLGLGQGRHDLLVTDEGCRQVGEHGLAVAAVAAETPAELLVSHRRLAFSEVVTGRFFGLASLVRQKAVGNRAGPSCLPPNSHLNTDPRSAWPALRCCRAASSALPCPDADPSRPGPP